MATIRKTTVVCQLCLRHNDEDIDLIKAVCRDKLNHKSSPRIRVYWDGLRRRLEQVPSGLDPIRPFPANWINRGRRFILCRGSEVCYGEDCYCAHSFEELNYWNSQLDSLTSIPKEPPPPKEHTEEDPHLPGFLPSARSVWPAEAQKKVQFKNIQNSQTDVQQPVYVQSRRAQRMEQTAAQDVGYQPSRPPPPSAPQPNTEDTTTNWRSTQDASVWSEVSNHQGFNTSFEPSVDLPTLWTRPATTAQAPVQTPQSTLPVITMEWPSTDRSGTIPTGSYSAEVAKLVNTASKEITYWGYKDKFLALLDLEQKEHDHILTTRCNGRYVLVLSPIGQELQVWQPANDMESDYERYGHILGLNGDQILYCTQASSGLTMAGGIEADVLSGNMFHTETKLYVAFDKKNAQRLKSELFVPDDAWDTTVDVQFTLKYSYFNALRDSVRNIQPDVQRKISPQPGDFHNFVKGSYSASIMRFRRGCSDDQREALDAILSSPSSKSPPVLITGAFGTGKTHLLAVAACCLLEQGKETGHPVRIFAASHRKKSPDTFLEQFYGLQNDENIRHYWNSVVRLQKRGFHGSHSKIPSHVYQTVAEFKRELHRLKNQRLFMLVGTYGNALQLSKLRVLPWDFTHILIDEGAQSREPEALSPLCLANEDTKLVIAGDQHQVGPRTLVLGEYPQQHGLAVSLLQRLHDLYSRSEFVPYTAQYSCTLTTNYRCHPDILKLLGELFYDVPLTCHSPPPLHPLAKSSFTFVCTSVQERAECVDPDQPFEDEARALLEEALKYVDNWPQSWGKRVLQEVCLMCPTRHQLTVVQEMTSEYPKARQIKRLPIYDMQGEEFRACFISTTEPTWKDGSSRNPTKGICDPFVFNTALTRAQSLVVAMGNPFLLLKMERHMVQKYPRIGKGWSTYIRECLSRNVLSFSPLLKLNVTQRTLYLNKLRVRTGLGPMPEPDADLSLSWEQYTRTVPVVVSQQKRVDDVGPWSTGCILPPRDLQSQEAWSADYGRPREVVGVKLPKQIFDNGYQDNMSSQLPSKKHTPSLDIRGPGLSRLEKDFEIVDKLGEGEMSVVYHVRNRENQKESAVKIMALPRMISDIEKTMADVKLVSRLHNEALLQYYKHWSEEALPGWKEYNLWGPLKPCEEASIIPCSTLCPYSPEAHTSVKKGGGAQAEEPAAEDTSYRSIFGGPTALHPSFLYIQSEVCTEGTLKDWLLGGKELRGVDIFDQVLDAVAFIHEKGFVHRNLKPSNIFLFKNSKIKVGDFGFVTNDLKYKSGSNVSSYYRSPEMLHGEACTQKADIFSLGIIYFELIYAPPPHDHGKVLLQLQNNMKFPPGFESQHFHEFNLIHSMIVRDPKERPSANEINVGEQLQKIRKSAKKLLKKSGKK